MSKVLHFIDNKGRRHYKRVSKNVMSGDISSHQQSINERLISDLLQSGNTCSDIGYKKGTVLGRNFVSIQDIIVSIKLSQLSERELDDIQECIKWSTDFNDDGVISNNDIVTLSNIVLFYQSYGCTRESSPLYYCNTHDCENESPPEIMGFDGWGNNQSSTRTNELPDNIVDPGGSCRNRDMVNYRGCPGPSDGSDSELYSNVNWGCYDYSIDNVIQRCDSCNSIDGEFEEVNYDCCYNYPSKEVNGNGQPDWYYQYMNKFGVNDPSVHTSTIVTNLKIDNHYVGYGRAQYIYETIYEPYGTFLPGQSNGMYSEWENENSWCCEMPLTNDCVYDYGLTPDGPVSRTIFNKIECTNNGYRWVSDTPYDDPIISVFFKPTIDDNIDQYTGCLNNNGYIDCSNIVGILPRYKSNTWYPSYNEEVDVNPIDLPPLKFQRDLLGTGNVTFDDVDDDNTMGDNGGYRYPGHLPYQPPVYILDVQLPSQGTHELFIRIWNPKDEQIYNGGCWTVDNTEGQIDFFQNSPLIQNPGLIEINTEDNVGIIGCPEQFVNINNVDYETCNYNECSVGCSDEDGYPVEGDVSCCTYKVCGGTNPMTDGVPFECVTESEIDNYPWKWTYYTDCDGDGLPCEDDYLKLCITDEIGIASLECCIGDGCINNPPLLGGICIDSNGNSIINENGMTIGCDPTHEDISTEYCIYMSGNNEDSTCSDIGLSDGSCDCPTGGSDDCGQCGGNAIIGDGGYIAPNNTVCNYDPLDPNNLLDCNCNCPDTYGESPSCIDECGICRTNEVYESNPYIITCYEDTDGDGISHLNALSHQCCPSGSIYNQSYCSDNIEPSCMNNNIVVQNICDICNDGNCDEGYTSNVLPECISINDDDIPCAYDESGECTITECESESCYSNEYECGSCITQDSVFGCMKHTCGDGIGECASTIYDLYRKDECYIDGLNNTCMRIECNINATPNIDESLNPCNSCGETNSKPGNPEWNTSCADCAGIPCKDGYAAHLCTNLNEELACEYFNNFYPNPDHWWGGELSYNCENKKDSTGNNCCNSNDVDECGVCNGSLTIPGYIGKERWWPDFDGDGISYGYPYNYEDDGFCGIYGSHDGEYSDDNNLYLHPRTSPPYNSVPENSHCLTSDDSCYIKTCNNCMYYNSDNTNIYTDDCNDISLKWIDGDGTTRYLMCIDDIDYQDCTSNHKDTCEICCNPNYCKDIGGCAGSGIICSNDNECDMWDGLSQTCVFSSNGDDVGQCFISNGIPSTDGSTGPNWDSICAHQDDSNGEFNTMCDCKNQGCGCNYQPKIKYYWDLDGDGRYGIDGNFYYCEDEYPLSLYNNPIENQWDMVYDQSAPDGNKCRLSNFSNYLCCEHPYYCSFGVSQNGCNMSNCNGCTIKNEIDNLLNPDYCTDDGCNCLNLNLIPINDEGNTLEDNTYYTIVSSESSIGVSTIKIKVDMEVPSGFEFNESYDSYTDYTVSVSLWSSGGEFPIEIDDVNILDEYPVAEFNQGSTGLSLSTGIYTLKSTYNGLTSSININISEPVYGCTNTNQIMCDDQLCNYCNDPTVLGQFPTHDTSCPPNDPDCPNNGSSCISPMRYYLDTDGDGIPCSTENDNYIWACPSYNEMQSVIDNNNYPSFGVIGYSGQYPGCYYDPPLEYCKPSRPSQFFDNPVYGMVTQEPTIHNINIPICMDSEWPFVSELAFCWHFNYNYTITELNWDENNTPQECKKWVGGSNFYEEGNWVTVTSNYILNEIKCHGYGYVLNNNTDESGQYCDCPGNIFDDCGVCLSPECINHIDCGGSVSNSNLSCNGNILLDNPCDNNKVPSNILWNNSCTGCTDPSASNYSGGATLPCSGYSDTCMGECEDPDEISPNKKLKCSTDDGCMYNGNDYGSCLYEYPTNSGLTLHYFSNPIEDDLNDIEITENQNNHCNENSPIYHLQESAENFCVNRGYDIAIVNCNELETSNEHFVWNVTSDTSIECISVDTGCSPSTYYIKCIDSTLDDSSQGPNCCCKYDNGCNDPGAPNYHVNCGDYGCNKDCEGVLLSECMFMDPLDIGELDYSISNSYNVDVLDLFISTDTMESSGLNYIITGRYIKINNEIMYVTGISNQIEINNSYNILTLLISRGMFGTIIESHSNGDRIILDGDRCNYNNCCVNYVTRGCTDENAINYYCNNIKELGYINEQLCPDIDNNGNGNLPDGDNTHPRTGHIKVESCLQSIDASCGGQYRYLPGNNTSNRINLINGPVYVDGPNGDVQIGEEEFILSSTWQGFPSWGNENGTLVNDDNVHWKFTGWNNNFNERFGNGNWISYIVDINDSPVPGLTKALKVKIYDYDGIHSVSGWGGLVFNTNDTNKPYYNVFDEPDTNYFSAWVKVISGQFQFGHLNTTNRIRSNSTNNEWEFIHSKHESQVTYGITHTDTENGVHVYANARNNDRTAEFYILLLHITDEWIESDDDNCCCEYIYDCNNSIITNSDIIGTFPNITYTEDSVSYYDECGICSDGESGHDPNVDNRGCGCFKGNPPIWYYDLDCPTALNENGLCGDIGVSDGYGCDNITMEYQNNGSIWAYCLPDQGGEIPDYYIHPSTFPGDGWSELGWIDFEQSSEFCECALNMFDCTGNCVGSNESYYINCNESDYEDTLCNNNDGECGGCDNCGICKGPNRDSNTCILDDGCDEDMLWSSISNPDISCNWTPDNNNSNFDCNCDCINNDELISPAYINDCGYCVGGNTDRHDNFGKDDCEVCNGNNWIGDSDSNFTPDKAWIPDASGDQIEDLWCNYRDPLSDMGCDCSCPGISSVPTIDPICGFCGDTELSISKCTGCDNEESKNYGYRDIGDGVNPSSYLSEASDEDKCQWIGTSYPGDGGITIHTNQCLNGGGMCIDCSGALFHHDDDSWVGFRRLDPFGMCCTHPEGNWENFIHRDIRCMTSCSTDYNSSCQGGHIMAIDNADECWNFLGIGWDVSNCSSGQSYCDNYGCECKGYSLHGYSINDGYDDISGVDFGTDVVTSRWKWTSGGCAGITLGPGINYALGDMSNEWCGLDEYTDDTCRDCHGGDCAYACDICDHTGEYACSKYNYTERELYWTQGNCVAFIDENDFTSTQLPFIHRQDGNIGKIGTYDELFNTQGCCESPEVCCKIQGGQPDFFFKVCTSSTDCSNADGTIVDLCDCEV
jgi:hypothetical protein